MGKFRLELKPEAIKDLEKHYKSGNKATLNKIEKILKELEIHPYNGIESPEPLKYELTGKWSRRINQKDRMIYSVDEDIVRVEVFSAMEHYDDK